MSDHFHCCDEVDADEAYRRGLAEGMAAGIREPCGHGSDSPIAGCNDPRHDEIESWYRQALAISQDRTDILSDVTAEGLLRLLAKAYMRGHSNGRNSNAPPNPKVAVEALLAKIVEDHDAR